MKTLTLTDETGKVLFKTNIDNWRVDQVRDGLQFRISVTGWSKESERVGAFVKNYTKGKLPDIDVDPAQVETTGSIRTSGGPLTREAWPSLAKKMAEEQEAAVAKLATVLWGPKSGLKSPLFSPGSLEQAGYRLGHKVEAEVRMDPTGAICRCDIKDLMSTGHTPKCPEAKKR